ncbi:methyltransferase domain-containing protein [Streptococcaceae bacterium ESL0687]|nr:methyltransferase domain-containing protein [Streptococcaceae bacterium ESL0687]
MLKKIDRAYNILEKDLTSLACPKCNQDFTLSRYSLKCKNNHNFDINKKGYVNFLSHKVVENYTKEMFIPRGKMIQAGMYAPMLAWIKDQLVGQSLLDIGCGEGSFINLLDFKGSNFAFDIARDGIILATNQTIPAFWSIADLTCLPYKDKSIDNLLNIFTPSNYQEFDRVMSDCGQLIKVIPDRFYLRELREAYGIPLDYDNSLVLEKFKDNYQDVEEKELSYTFDIPEDLRLAFLDMSPLEWQVDQATKERVRKDPPKTATVHVKILVGKKPSKENIKSSNLI